MALSETMPTTVVILAHHSLLSGGIASRLSEYVGLLRVRLIDSELDDIAGELKMEPPSVIILDAGDSKVCQKLPIVKLLEWAPQAKVIRLDLASDRVRVFSSTELQVNHAGELVDLIQNFSREDSIL